MEKIDFLKHTASETIMQIVEKLYGGQSIVKDCPESISREEATEDIAYLRFVLENAYSGYTYHDKALFDGAFAALEKETALAENFTPAQLIEMICDKLGFITDGHLQLTGDTVRYSLKPHKTFLFKHGGNEERIECEVK